MAPEQEDAHWTLQGKPLMRHWLARAKLYAEGNKLYAEGNKLYAEGAKLYAEGNKLRAEGDKLYAEGAKLRAEGDKLYAEGNLLWVDAVIATYGKGCVIDWQGGGCCAVDGALYTKET